MGDFFFLHAGCWPFFFFFWHTRSKHWNIILNVWQDDALMFLFYCLTGEKRLQTGVGGKRESGNKWSLEEKGGKNDPATKSSRKFNKNPSKKKKSPDIEKSRNYKRAGRYRERGLIVFGTERRRKEPRAATSNEPSLSEGVKPCDD